MRAWSIALLVLAACAGSPPPPSAEALRAPAPPPSAAVTARTLSPADIAFRALPAIVTIRTESSLGTGFVLRSDGWIATNLHVIVGGPHLKVTLRDARELEVVEVLAASPEHDLALLRVEARDLPVLSLGDSDAMRAGDAVVAIGNPLGLEDTVSNGLVSARRTLDHDTEVLQISAPIAPGSSGGPIFNDHGEVIGIATAVLLQGQNLNFGMPARYLLPMLKDPKPVRFTDFAKALAQARDAAAAKVHRKHPRYPLAMLDGCSFDAQKLIVLKVEKAIDTGAPLYNAGDHDGCYHVYDGTASDVMRKLPTACGGPTRALAEAQKRAASLPDATSQAWAMRDAFDALLDVITRKQRP
jgi:serine protease Do